MHEFDPSHVLTRDSKFRTSLRYKPSFGDSPTERLDKMHGFLTSALQKHGAEKLTNENFDKVTKHLEEDSQWRAMPEEARKDFGNALRAELELPPIQEQE